MKLPSFKRLNKIDFDDKYNDLIEGLSFIINNSIESLNEALNKNLSLKDNTACTVKDIEVSVKDSTGILNSKVTVKLDTKDTPIIGISVIDAIAINSNTLPDSGVFLKYSQNGDYVDFTYAKGLPINVKFQLRVVIYV